MEKAQPASWVIPTIIVILFAAITAYFIYRSMQEQEDKDGEVFPFFAHFFFNVLLKPVIPVFRLILPALGLHPKSQIGTFIRQLLDNAGLYDYDEEDVMATQLVMAVALYFSFISFLGTTSMITCLPLIPVGWGYPIYLLQSIGFRRKQTMHAELPYVLDLLSLGIEAGLDFKMAVERIVNFSEPSPLINEMKGLLNDLNFGTPMEEALIRLRRRIDILAFFTFVEALIQATQMGIDVSSTLRAQSEQMRIAYFQSIEKSANKLPIMVLFPTAFCIFPPILIITLGPIAIDIHNRFPK